MRPTRSRSTSAASSGRCPSDVGQKTGFYFDQRDLRGARRVARASGKRVLDAYSYIGAFGLAAARGGATEVVCVDESAVAVEVGAEQARLNGFEKIVSFQRGDARRMMQEAHGSFDLTIVDPPRLAPTRGAREQALVMYAKLAELGCRATKPGGLLVLCSCSAAVDLFALTRALATGAVRANVHATVVERAFQGVDHPVPAAFAEGLYLKAVIARVEQAMRPLVDAAARRRARPRRPAVRPRRHGPLARRAHARGLRRDLVACTRRVFASSR